MGQDDAGEVGGRGGDGGDGADGVLVGSDCQRPEAPGDDAGQVLREKRGYS